MDMQFISHGIGLIILMGVNITLGSLGALFVKCFDWRRCLQGIAKCIVIIFCFIATYIAGYINQDIVAINVGGLEANVTTGLGIIVFMGYYHYAIQVFEKLRAFISEDFSDDMKKGLK